MMDDLVTFLRARLDEDAAAAQAASWDDWYDNRWTAHHRKQYDGRWTIIDQADEGVISTVDPQAADDAGVAQHIARHDPARVLAEVEAKRAILRWHSTPHTVVDGFCADEGGPCTHRGEAECSLCGETACATLRLLALPYADHPDYREDWRP
jgi:hypothetical protein